MFCDRCGTKLADQAAFCRTCGKPAGIAPLVPVQSRIAGHVRLLGILWLALSAFRLIPGLVLVAFVSFLPPRVPPFVLSFLPLLGGVLLITAIAGLVAGIGLLTRQPWARMLAIVLGVLNLPDLPLGLALGIYTLWVLLPAQSEQEYRAESRVA